MGAEGGLLEALGGGTWGVLALVVIVAWSYIVGMSAIALPDWRVWRKKGILVALTALALLIWLFGGFVVGMGATGERSGLERVALIFGGVSMIACGSMAYLFAKARQAESQTAAEALITKRSNRLGDLGYHIQQEMHDRPKDPELLLQSMAAESGMLSKYVGQGYLSPTYWQWKQYQELTGNGDWKGIEPKLRKLTTEYQKLASDDRAWKIAEQRLIEAANDLMRATFEE